MKKTIDKQLQEIKRALELNINRLEEIEKTVTHSSMDERQTILLHEIVKNDTQSIFSEGVQYFDLKEEFKGMTAVKMYLLEFIYNSVKLGESKYLKGYGSRISYDIEKNGLGILEFGEQDSYELFITIGEYQEDTEVVMLTVDGKALGEIDFKDRILRVQEEYLIDLLKIVDADNEKDRTLVKKVIYALSKGLETVNITTNYGLLDDSDDSRVLYNVFEYDGSNDALGYLMEQVMLMYYNSIDEGVFYPTKNEGEYCKKVGETSLILKSVVEEEEDEEVEKIYYGTLNKNKGSLYDLFGESKELLRLFFS